MEKQIIIQSDNFFSSTLDNMENNTLITIKQVSNLVKLLDKTTKSIIVPLFKINQKIALRFESYVKEHKDMLNKIHNAQNDILKPKDNPENSAGNIPHPQNQVTISDLQLHTKSANNHENLIAFYEEVIHKMSLFKNLLGNEDFKEIICEFNKVIPDDDLFESAGKDREKLSRIEKDNVKVRTGESKKKDAGKNKENKGKSKENAGKSKDSKGKSAKKSKKKSGKNGILSRKEREKEHRKNGGKKSNRKSGKNEKKNASNKKKKSSKSDNDNEIKPVNLLGLCNGGSNNSNHHVINNDENNDDNLYEEEMKEPVSLWSESGNENNENNKFVIKDDTTSNIVIVKENEE